MRFHQRFEIEHDARTTLRIGRRPSGLGLLGGGNGGIEHGLIAKRDGRLNRTIVGIKNVTGTRRGRYGATCYEMVDYTHVSLSSNLCHLIAPS
jgi:hypothetical protein